MRPESHASAAPTGRNPEDASADGDVVLRVDHLTKRYGDHTVVDDLTFVASPGRVTGFLGPNGSGKSTAMKVMLDLMNQHALSRDSLTGLLRSFGIPKG